MKLQLFELARAVAKLLQAQPLSDAHTAELQRLREQQRAIAEGAGLTVIVDIGTDDGDGDGASNSSPVSIWKFALAGVAVSPGKSEDSVSVPPHNDSSDGADAVAEVAPRARRRPSISSIRSSRRRRSCECAIQIVRVEGV